MSTMPSLLQHLPIAERDLRGQGEPRRQVVQHELRQSVVSELVDPIEKKPLFHFYPGEEVFSLGSIGCNFRCRHCFVPGTFVVTRRGAHSIEKISDIGKDELLTHSGRFMKVKDVFDHHYSGQVCRVKARYLPEIVLYPRTSFPCFSSSYFRWYPKDRGSKPKKRTICRDPQEESIQRYRDA